MNYINPDPDDRQRRGGAQDPRHRHRQSMRATRADLPRYRENDLPRNRENSAARNTRSDLIALREDTQHSDGPQHRKHMSRPNAESDDDTEFALRQLAGLNMLMAIAEPVVTFVPFSGATVRMRYTGAFEVLERLHDLQSGSVAGQPQPTSRPGAIWAFIRTDQMLRNSLYLVLNSGLQAALGFGFWIITARFFTTAMVGQASSLISATTLIAFLGLFGLNTALVRYLPIARRRNTLITAGLTIVASSSAVIAIFYIILIPFISKPLDFVAHSLPLAIGFIVLTAGGGVNVLTDSVFVAAGKANYNALVDGIVGGVAKVVLLVALAGTGAYGIFGAATGGFAAAAVASIILIVRILRWRPDFRSFGRVLKPILRFSGMNYIGNVLNLLPTMIVPLIVISRLGATADAYYYVAFQLASLLYAAVYAVEQAFLAEGAHSGTINKAVLMRSARILLALCVPASIGMMLLGHQLLAAFGANYQVHAESSLIALTIAVLPIAVYNWCLTVLRLSNQLRAIVWSNAVYCVAIIGLAYVLATGGIGDVAMAWPIGTTAGALVAGGAAFRSLRRSQTAYSRGGRRAERVS